MLNQQANETPPAQADRGSVNQGAFSQWQPIETAPKDGTEIIGWNGKSVTCYSWTESEDDNDHSGWCVSGYSYGGILYDLHNVPDVDPTHWMPLPPAPCRDGF